MFLPFLPSRSHPQSLAHSRSPTVTSNGRLGPSQMALHGPPCLMDTSTLKGPCDHTRPPCVFQDYLLTEKSAD